MDLKTDLLALASIQKCATPHGLFASAPPNGYTMVFARDSMISLIGASASPASFIQKQFAKSLETLARFQSPTGQIPNAVDHYDPRREPTVSFSTIDSTLWWLVGLKHYAKRFNDESMLRRFKPNVQKAFHWLACQDTGEDSMPEQHPTSDWQDAFPHKYGHTINTQALYYLALRLHGQQALAQRVREAANGKKREDWCLWSDELGYYRAWRWKNHGQFHETEDWFDSLGNLLAILTGFATEHQAHSILKFIEKHKIAKPFPIRAIYPPISSKSREWQDYFTDSAAGVPNEYLNGGIWPFIGGLYVCALVYVREFDSAREALALLGQANRLSPANPFPEWVRPTDSQPFGEHQAWSAGGYLWAAHAVATKKVLLFE